MIEQLVARVFTTRNLAHLAHWKTTSYAQHMALGTFYEDIIGLADELAEAWMGRNLQKIGEIPTINVPKGEPLNVFKRLLEVVQDTRDFVSDDTVLSNIIDEIEQLYSSTIYKLKFLK